MFVWLSKLLIDLATSGNLEGNFLLYSLFLIAALFFQHACTIFRSRLDSYTNVLLINSLRERLFYRVMLAEWSGKEQFHTGDITTRLDGDVRQIATTITTTFPSMVISAIQFVASFFFMLVLDSRLAWALLVIMPISLLMSKRYVLKLRKLTHSIREIDSSVQSHIQEKVSNRAVINAMGGVSNVFSELKTLGVSLFSTTMNRTNYTLFSRGMVQFGFSAGYVTAFLWGVNGLSSGVITFGVMTAFLQLVARIQLPIVELSSQVSTIAQTITAADRLAELDALSIEEQGSRELLDGAVGVKFSSLSYSYKDSAECVISNFSYNFAPNKLHIILGKTGVGKSTILRLILGFLTPSKGVVEIYSKMGSSCLTLASDTAGATATATAATAAASATAATATTATQKSRCNYVCSPLTRANFIYVPQGNTLISGSIRDNLLLGNNAATEEEISLAIYTAAAEFVYNLPNGLDTLCGERGAGLSEGEAQRVAIARGLLKSGSVLLLDEPTSALDANTERLLIDRLLEYAKNRTIIMVTHRESVAEGDNLAQILRM